MRAHAGREATVPLEILLELLRIHALGIANAVVLRAIAEHLGPLPIEVDQFLGNHLALLGIGTQEFRPALPGQHRGKLPSQVEGVLHGEIHALTRLGAVGVAGIACDENVGKTRSGFLLGNVVIFIANALADFVNGPPGNLFHLQLVGMKNALRCGDELVERDAAIGHPLLVTQLVHLDVKPHQIAALARNHQKVAIFRLDGHLIANVGEVGHGKHVHYAPGVVGRVADQLTPDGPAHAAASAVAADHVASLQRFYCAGMNRVRSLQTHGDRIVVCARVDR